MKQSAFLKSLTIGISVFCILLALLVLIGWYTNTVELIQVLPVFVPMQYNTALGFLLGGISLYLAFNKKLNITIGLLLLLGSIGFLTLLEYIIGVNIGLDELFMKHYITVETSHPGRMAPNTALCFLLSSIAMSLTFGKNIKKMQISSILGALIFGLGIIAFIGYLIGMEGTYGGGKLTRMAVHTSVGFMVLGTGVTVLNLHQDSYSKNLTKNAWLTGYAFVLALVIFFIDLSLPLGVAMGIPYILFVIFGWFIKQEGITWILAICSTVFIIVAYIYAVEEYTSWMVMANRAFAIMAVWLVAGLLSHIKKNEAVLYETNQELDEKLVLLKNKNKELAQFTYIASHDLQEPLRTVMNFTELFGQQYKDKFDANANKYLFYISQASQRMSNLIKGLLDYSRIGQNRDKSHVDINEILEEIQSDLTATINETNTRFKIVPLPKVMGFRVDIRMLFQNLILNAIKFKKMEIDPIINISAADKIDFYEFTVADNGIGIEKQHQQKIFSIFQRLHTKKEYEGTGIGLAHCQKIVEMHEGAISVTSMPQEGSKFIFTIKK